MMTEGLGVYATRKYARLNFDKYVGENRAMDNFAASLTKKMPSIVYLGAAQVSPNSPIGIKKRWRCPGNRKLLRSFKKLGNVIVRFVDEYFTSQTCARCFGRFDPRTKPNRFKVCQQCHMDENALLPRQIISTASKRQLKKWREQQRIEGNPTRPAGTSLVSKIIVFYKCYLNDAGDLVYFDDQTKTVWHRDIVAAKCILYKGIIELK